MHDPAGHDGGDDARLLSDGRRIDDDQVCALAGRDLSAVVELHGVGGRLRHQRPGLPERQRAAPGERKRREQRRRVVVI